MISLLGMMNGVMHLWMKIVMRMMKENDMKDELRDNVMLLWKRMILSEGLDNED